MNLDVFFFTSRVLLYSKLALALWFKKLVESISAQFHCGSVND